LSIDETVEMISTEPSARRDELNRHFELIYALVRSELSLRYKQTILGPAWVLLEPVLQMVVFTLVFGKIKQTQGVDITVAYPIFVYSGLLPWTYFRFVVTKASANLVTSKDVIDRVYFPREYLILSTIIAGVFDYAISILILFVLMVVYHVPFRLEILLCIPLLAGLAVLTMGVSFYLSILYARFRDVRYMVPYLIQAWMFLSPVIYPPTFLSSNQWLLSINPLTGYLEAFRSAMIGTTWEFGDLAISLIMTVVIFAAGWVYFRKNIALAVDVL
jgi:lipopolysaccharide transport system permease protein